MKTNAKEVKAIALKAFPEYKGRKFFVEIVADDRAFNLNSFWDGGSKDSYCFVTLNGSIIREVPQNGSGFDRKNYEGIPIPPEWVLVQKSVCQGIQCGLTVYVRQSDSNPSFLTLVGGK